MRKLLALTFMLMQCFSALAMTAARRAISFRAASETATQGASIPTSPRNLPDTNDSLSLVSNSTPSIQFHIPDSPVDLSFTFLGGPLILWVVVDAVELALAQIAVNVDLHPTELITNGRFRQDYNGLEIKIYQYIGSGITWYLLERILLGIIYYTSQRIQPRELRFEIYVMGQGRVGYGSLWQTGRADVAKRALIHQKTPQRLSLASRISHPALTTTVSTHCSLFPTLNDSHIIFSYHLFGPPIPEPAIALCFSRARQSICTRLQSDPFAPIPSDTFEYSLDHIPVFINVTAYPGKQISWLLLDRVLRDVSADIIGGHHLRGCEFEFEIDPFLEPHGRGFLEYYS